MLARATTRRSWKLSILEVFLEFIKKELFELKAKYQRAFCLCLLKTRVSWVRYYIPNDDPPDRQKLIDYETRGAA